MASLVLLALHRALSLGILCLLMALLPLEAERVEEVQHESINRATNSYSDIKGHINRLEPHETMQQVESEVKCRLRDITFEEMLLEAKGFEDAATAAKICLSTSELRSIDPIDSWAAVELVKLGVTTQERLELFALTLDHVVLSRDSPRLWLEELMRSVSQEYDQVKAEALAVLIDRAHVLQIGSGRKWEAGGALKDNQREKFVLLEELFASPGLRITNLQIVPEIVEAMRFRSEVERFDAAAALLKRGKIFQRQNIRDAWSVVNIGNPKTTQATSLSNVERVKWMVQLLQQVARHLSMTDAEVRAVFAGFQPYLKLCTDITGQEWKKKIGAIMMRSRTSLEQKLRVLEIVAPHLVRTLQEALDFVDLSFSNTEDQADAIVVILESEACERARIGADLGDLRRIVSIGASSMTKKMRILLSVIRMLSSNSGRLRFMESIAEMKLLQLTLPELADLATACFETTSSRIRVVKTIADNGLITKTTAPVDGFKVVQLGSSVEEQKTLFDMIRVPKYMEADAAELLKKFAFERKSAALAAATAAKRSQQHKQ